MSWSKLLKPNLPTRLAGSGTANIRGDLFGGLTAAVVALPLALAFGVASGAGPIAGLYGAIATGFFAALFGGTPAQVSGPTGPMTVVMGAIVASHSDSLPEAFTIVMLGGLLQMLFGFLRIGRYVTYTPRSVVSGFMTGIGVIIIVIQLLPFIGLPTSNDGVLATLRTFLTMNTGLLDFRVIGLSTATLLLIVYWPSQLARVIPAPLGALLMGTFAAAVAIPSAPTIGAIPSGLPELVIPVPSASALVQMLQPALILALLGSIDSLLTSLVADSVTKTRHDSDKELVGQGLGNMVAGLIGALPGAGATMRTVVNIRAGGHSPVSGMLHSIVLLALVLGLGPAVAFVPHAVLAAILMNVGWEIIDWGYIKRLRRVPREKAFVMLITLLLTVFVDLITAVAVGIIAASFVTAKWLAEEQLKGLKQVTKAADLDDLTTEETSLLNAADGRILITELRGSFSYASARELERRDIQALELNDVVIYDFTHSAYIDPSGAMAIDAMIDSSKQQDTHVIVAGLRGQSLRTLEGMGVLDRIPASNRFEHRTDAIAAAAEYCRSTPRP